MDEYKGGKSHTITPVIYPACTTALVPHKPLKGAKNRNAELVHKNEKKNNNVEPQVRQDPRIAPHPHNKEQENPI